MGHGIENMAYDWITNNIYWTDSELNWIVAADASLKYYSPIYESPSTAPYGLAIQARKRWDNIYIGCRVYNVKVEYVYSLSFNYIYKVVLNYF